MPEIARLDGGSDSFELDLRSATPKPLMKLSIHLYAAELSFPDDGPDLEGFGVDRVHLTVHNWVRKGNLKPDGGKSPEHVAIDESVIQLNGDRYWLYSAVNPETNEVLHVSLYNRCVAVYSTRFTNEFLDKDDLEDAVFLVDGAPGYIRRSTASATISATKPTADATPSNISSKKKNVENTNS